MNNILTDRIEQALMLKNLLIAVATGGDRHDPTYRQLRQTFMDEPALANLLPSFVRTCRDLSAFWPHIQSSARTYQERRTIIHDAFIPLLDFLEGRNSVPVDSAASDTLKKFDLEGVHAVWMKAISRRLNDPEGAITIARTLLETVTKRILDECGEKYSDSDDLPKLYAAVARVLNLAPNQHTEEPIRAILGGAMNLVNGIGTLRNRLSDSHGRGGRLPVKPSPRHAGLAVNTAGSIAAFLVETYLAKQEHPVPPRNLT